MHRQAIAGLKYRQGLCLLRLGQTGGAAAALLCQQLADQRINLVLAGGVFEDGGGETWLCLPEEFLDRAWRTARELPLSPEGLGESPEVIAPVALLTIYPLGPGLALCARVMSGMAEAGLTILALGVSLSALVVALAQDDLPQAMQAMQALLELPTGVTPSEQPRQVIEVTPRPQE